MHWSELGDMECRLDAHGSRKFKLDSRMTDYGLNLVRTDVVGSKLARECLQRNILSCLGVYLLANWHSGIDD